MDHEAIKVLGFVEHPSIALVNVVMGIIGEGSEDMDGCSFILEPHSEFVETVLGRSGFWGKVLCQKKNSHRKVHYRPDLPQVKVMQAVLGKKRFEEVSVLRQAVVAIVQRYRVEEFLWLRYTQRATPRAVRACRDRPARIEENR
jgi:hypothetical protein